MKNSDFLDAILPEAMSSESHSGGNIFVFGFDDTDLERFSKAILNAERNPEIPEIFIWVSSYGGLVHNVFGMVDLIDHCSKPVWTIALGKAMSAGCVLVSAGHPGKRCATPTSYIMFHEANGGAMGRTQEVIQQAKEMEQLNDRMIKIVSQNTGKSEKNLKKLLKDKHNTDIVMDARAAQLFGLVDHIGVPKIMTRTDTQVGVAVKMPHPAKPAPRAVKTSKKAKKAKIP